MQRNTSTVLFNRGRSFEHFIGRKKELALLQENFNQLSPIQIISGLAGAGGGNVLESPNLNFGQLIAKNNSPVFKVGASSSEPSPSRTHITVRNISHEILCNQCP